MKKITLLIAGCMLYTAFSCSNDGGDSIDPLEAEKLSPEDVEILDNLPEAEGFTPETVILPNGMSVRNYLMEVDPEFNNEWGRMPADSYASLGPQDARNLLIARLNMVAMNLVDRSRHQIAATGDDSPAQNGLAYSWGAKDHSIRQFPPGEGTMCSDQKIKGLDCSGFIHTIFQNAGVSIVSGPADKQRKVKTLKESIKNSIPALAKITVDDLGKLSSDKFESGDIIYWKTGGVAQHIGIILKKADGGLAVFQSNGSVGNDAADCTKNLGPTRGPRTLELNDPYWFGTSKAYGIVRINAEISGKWEFRARCEGTSTDFATHMLDFPSGKNSTFKVTKLFTDYDGSSNKTIFNFSYDKSTNRLSCNMVTSETGFERVDAFDVKLERDLIDYTAAQSISFSAGGGCTIEIRLQNMENDQ